MSVTSQIAKHLREVHFGGNWTASNLKDCLADLTWQQATTRVHSFNTIAALVFHMNYYIVEVTKVLQGAALDASDKRSFSHPEIRSQDDWERMVAKVWLDAEKFAGLIGLLPDDLLEAAFTDKKYGSYFRNLLGIIEHFHYHLGQIVLIRKIILEKEG